MMIIASILASLFAVAPSDGSADRGLRVLLRTLDEDKVQATLVQITPDSVGVLIDGEVRSIPMEDVLRISPRDFDASDAGKTLPAQLTCYPVEGGLLNGEIAADAPTGSLRLAVGLNKSIAIPMTAIAAIRFGPLDDPTMVAEFEKRRRDRKPGRDVLLIDRDGRPSVVPGALESLSSDGWTFRFGKKSRTGRYSSAFGVVLGSASARGERGDVSVSFGASNELFGRIIEGDDRAILFDAGPIGRMSIPWSLIRGLDFSSGRVVRLSDLTPARETNSTIVGGEWPARRNQSVIGQRLRIGSRSYDDGWGVHANSRLEFALDGEFASFVGDVGIDASVGLRGSAVFRVVADGKTLFSTDVMRGGQAAKSIKVDLSGSKHLVLECDRADGLGLSDHGNWVNAFLVRRKDRDPS